MEERLITKKEAVASGLSFYFTGKPCKYGHVDDRYVKSGNCRSCMTAFFAKQRREDPGRYADTKAAYYERNRTETLEYFRQYYKDHREEALDYMRQWYRANSAKAKADASMKRARKKQRTAPWADMTDIERIYTEAERAEKKAGVKLHVDHYYPLKGETVSGLHVAENLRIITAEENELKKNKHPDDWEREKQERGLTFPSIDQYLVTRPSESA